MRDESSGVRLWDWGSGYAVEKTHSGLHGVVCSHAANIHGIL